MDKKTTFVNRLKLTPLQQQVINRAKSICKREEFLVKFLVSQINEDLVRLDEFDDESRLFLTAWREAFDVPETEEMTIESLKALASFEV